MINFIKHKALMDYTGIAKPSYIIKRGDTILKIFFDHKDYHISRKHIGKGILHIDVWGSKLSKLKDMLWENKENKYLDFVLAEQKPKTRVYSVVSKKTEFRLGEVKWYSSWRRYAFFPEECTIFDRGCLEEILEFIDKLTKERKESEDGKF